MCCKKLSRRFLSVTQVFSFTLIRTFIELMTGNVNSFVSHFMQLRHRLHIFGSDTRYRKWVIFSKSNSEFLINIVACFQRRHRKVTFTQCCSQWIIFGSPDSPDLSKRLDFIIMNNFNINKINLNVSDIDKLSKHELVLFDFQLMQKSAQC